MKLALFPVAPVILVAIAGIAGASAGLEKSPANLAQRPAEVVKNHSTSNNSIVEKTESPGLDAVLRKTSSGVVVDALLENRDGKLLALKNEVVVVDDQETPLNLSTESPALRLSRGDANAQDTLVVPRPASDGYYIVLVRTAVLDTEQATQGAVKEQRRFVYVKDGEMNPVSEEEFSNNSRMNLARTLDEGGGR